MIVLRLLSPTRRRIATVQGGSLAAQQLRALGWKSYYGPATVDESFDGNLTKGIGPVTPDPRNGWVVPGSDPAVTPKVPYDRPAGSVDSNPHALNF